MNVASFRADACLLLTAVTPDRSVDQGYGGSAGSDDSGTDDGLGASAANDDSGYDDGTSVGSDDSGYDDGTSMGTDDSGYDDGSYTAPASAASPPVNGAMSAQLSNGPFCSD